MKDRVLKVMNMEGLTISDFAKKIDVLPSQVSHIKSGRNQVTLDFITKILTSYPEISSDWLIFGKGDMMRNSSQQADIQSNKQENEAFNPQMSFNFDENPTNGTEYNKENELTEKENSEEKKAVEPSLFDTAQTAPSNNAPQEEVSVAPKVETQVEEEVKTSSTVEETSTPIVAEVNPAPAEPVHVDTTPQSQPTGISMQIQSPSVSVKKIVVFYSDKTYEEFIPNNN